MYCLYIKTLFTTISTTFFIIFRSVDKIDVTSMTKDMINPYDKDETAKNIVKKLREYEIPSTTKKEFYDVSSTLL